METKEIKADNAMSLGDYSIRQDRVDMISNPHIKPLTDFVATIREEKGLDYDVPYFDPMDGGVEGKVLFVLEAPGPKAVHSGFISRNNPDQSAKNMFGLLTEARFRRDETILWNIVPWYIGDERHEKIRAAKREDIEEGLPYLYRLISLLPNLKAIVLVGKNAWKARSFIEEREKIQIFQSYHPSLLFVNRKPGNRCRILEVFCEVRAYIS